MVKGVNKVILIGNLGVSPTLKYTINGNPVINLSIATTTSWKDVNTAVFSDRTEWHKVVIYNKLANAVANYLQKGVKVYVEGFLRTSKWTDNAGIIRYNTEIVANTLLLLNSIEDTKDVIANKNDNKITKNSVREGKDSADFFDDDDVPF